MTLAAGTRLGAYEIVATIGAGGMGEVYRARDTKLGREVAVKVLPAHLTESAELRSRLEREARTVSSLNHPHICTLHDVGREGDIDYLVTNLGQNTKYRASKTAPALALSGSDGDPGRRLSHRAPAGRPLERACVCGGVGPAADH